MYFFLEGFSYLLYLIFECQTPNTKFILLKSKKKLCINLNTFFKERPIILFKRESFHERGGEDPDKVVTYSEKKIFDFYTSRDTSGPFIFDQKFNKNKYYIRLKLPLEIHFADNQTYYQYEKEKEELIQKNRNKDIYYSLEEKISINNVKYYNFIKVGDYDLFLQIVFGLFYLLFLLLENCIHFILIS